MYPHTPVHKGADRHSEQTASVTSRPCGPEGRLSQKSSMPAWTEVWNSGESTLRYGDRVMEMFRSFTKGRSLVCLLDVLFFPLR